MFCRQQKRSRDGELVAFGPNQVQVCAPTQSQSQRIKDNGFSSSSFAGEDAQTAFKFDIEPFNQHNIAYGKVCQHSRVAPMNALRMPERRLPKLIPGLVAVGLLLD